MSGQKQKRSVMKRYDLTAEIYDSRYSKEQEAKYSSVFEGLRLPVQGRVLDVGCGTGLMFDWVVHRAETVVGLDISRGMLLKARERAKGYTNVHLVQADADHLPFQTHIFKMVFAFTVLQNMPEPGKLLDEVVRVATVDSLVVVTGLKKVFEAEAFKRFLASSDLTLLKLLDRAYLKCFVAVCCLNASRLAAAFNQAFSNAFNM